MEWVLIGLGTLVIGFTVGFFGRKLIGSRKLADAESRAKILFEEAESKAKTIRKEAELEAKDAQLKARAGVEKEIAEKQRELHGMEKRLQTKEDNLEKKFNLVETKEGELIKQEKAIQDKKAQLGTFEKQYQDLMQDTRRALERAAGITMEDAKKQLRESLIEDAKRESATVVMKIEEEAKAEAQNKAKYIIASTIERLSSEYVSERSLSVVPLPNEELKGRIIGREGRNIRAFEAATGIDVVAKVTEEVSLSIVEAGEQAFMELKLPKAHPEIVKLLGALKYRYSYAQNVLRHSIEVGFVCGMMASELKIDEMKARRAGLLHDVGKAVSHEVEGAHALIGMEFCKKYKEDEAICHAVGAHHEDIPQIYPLDCLVDAADALSGARPGARREVLESYVKRLEDLEKISLSFKGVEKAYAVQAGREIRVMVNCQEVTDAQAFVISKDIARKIEQEMTYPGQIKITVIREMRATEYAK